ncbi:ATP-dependent DNA helicase MCM (intein-containing) [Natronomonas moolapensis 8.8.11]|uniref:DNA helicase n=1 Tax=Natronomonas moolapensis (strain DSM 18674 / CECT 7526 / JCM 14361 / 8.8.11) TaxID=268739 RepID=M1XKT0_NATM8|nr:LAGLIDADG family homing endonuclease [Natronomonas moolapensis]CCQ36450.1 ATP-dependent DNA helicase MCM (intein-containing) [Natronomonas moolapensis 8.8.11]
MARAEDTEVIDKFETFYRDYYRNEIGQLAQKYPNEKRSLYVDWNDLYRFDPDLADDFIAQPDQMLEYAEEALRLYDLPVDVKLGQAHVRVQNLQRTTGIRDIRARHRGQLVEVSGIVRKATDVRPKVIEAAFECQRCGTLTRIPQTSGEFYEPHECQGCERQGPFDINFDQSEFVDAQKLRVQESPEGLRGGETPQSIDVHIDDDITGRVTAGDHVRVTGVLHLEQQGSNQEKSPVFDVYMDGMAVEIEDEQFEDMDITDEDKKRIIELSNESDIYEKMIASMAPSIYGYDQEKLAIIMQLFSGVTKHLPDGSRTRGDLHMLLIGDPGTGKCLKSDTKVSLPDGTQREIGKLVEGNLDDPTPVDDGFYQKCFIPVLTTDGRRIVPGTASKLWKRQTPERMYNIRTESGNTLEVTPSHPLFRQIEGRLEPTTASELEEGDFIATPTELPSEPDESIDIQYAPSESPNANRLHAPETLTDGVARLIGYVVGEGHISGGEFSQEVTVTNADEEILEDVSTVLGSLGLRYRRQPHQTKPSVSTVRCSSVELARFFEALEPNMLERSAHQRVPDVVLRARPQRKAEFLRAYVDGECTVSPKEREIVVASMSEELLEDVQSLLLSFGIQSQLHPRNNDSYRLRISGADFERYVGRIGFVTERKAVSAAEFDDVEANTNTDVVPNVGGTLRDVREALALSQFDCGVPRTTYQHYERGDRNPSRSTLHTVLNAFEARTERLSALRERVTDGGWDAIVTARDELGISQAALADGMDVSQTAISYYERNEVAPDGGCVMDASGVVLDRLDAALSVAEDIDRLRALAESDIGWDRIDSIEAVDPDYEWVYDLEVEGTHTYISNNVVSHNSQLLQYIRNLAPRSVYTSGKGSSSAGLTAAAVRDDFGDGQQWTLEAGALVLADQGIAAVDELDKMRCVTGDTLVHLSDGRLSRINELAREAKQGGTIEELPNGRTIRNIDLTAWTMSDTGRLVERPITAIHEYGAPEELTEITLESGERISATHDHPFFVFEDGKRHKRPATDLEPGDWTYVPKQLSEPTTDGGIASDSGGGSISSHNVQPSFGAVLGYLSGDGNVYYNRHEERYGIRFINNQEELLQDFEQACIDAFGKVPVRHPSGQRNDGVETVRLHGREYADRVLDAGMNVETHDDKSFPTRVTTGTRRTKAAFIRAFADSEGNVDSSTGNVRMYSASGEILLGIKSLLLEFGISCQIRTRERSEKRDIHVLGITSAESIRSYNRHIGFTLERKQDALAEVCASVDGDRTTIDVLPDCGDLLRDVRASLRLHQSECGIDGTTYCNFENGDANCSLHRASTILEAFEKRIETANRDTEVLVDDCNWDSLQRLKDRYHVSQGELANGTALSQQQISKGWENSEDVREIVRAELHRLVVDVSNTELSPLDDLINGDVKWRRVRSVDTVVSGPKNDRIPILQQELADVLDSPPAEVTSRAQELLDRNCKIESWTTLRDELDTYGIPLWVLGSDLGVTGLTISRWSNGIVETDRFEEVKTAAENRISEKCSKIRKLLNEIESRREANVYDLTVEGTHNFVANGMVVHNSEDRSAMHEALEQQSYHPDTELLLADGRRVDIGEFVDTRMQEHPERVTDGVDCEILPVEDVRVHSTDFETNETTKLPVDRVSRHEAPEEFVRVSFSNGREVTVTPEHPMFVDDGGEIGTVEADDIEVGAFVPAPRKLPNSSAAVELDGEPHRGKEKDVRLPAELSGDLAEILGFLVAEGHAYAGSTHEIGFSSHDERLLERMDRLVQSVFGVESTDTTNAAGTVTKRWVSTELYRWFQRNVPGVMETARDRRVPDRVLGASEEAIRRFLVGAFAGDGGVESEAMSFSTASDGLAEDYADALAKVGVASRIHHDATEDSWKVYVMGDSTERFVDSIVDPADERYEEAQAFVERSNEARRHHDVLPTSAARELRDLKRLLGVGRTGKFRTHFDEGYGIQIETVREELEALRTRAEEVERAIQQAETLAEIRAVVGWSGRQLADRIEGATTGTIHYAESGGYDAARRSELADHARNAAYAALDEFDNRAGRLDDRCDLRYYRVTDVETIPNEGEDACEWVYDVTVEPTNTFVSRGVVLHNSISISKAGINATLKSRCSLLGAANPKYGRFDQYEPIGEQIDLEPALISRFDLIFTVTDQPDAEEDANLAEHIINTNYAGELHTHRENTTTSNVSEEEVENVTEDVEPEIDAELLRKYVAYAKRNCYPMMTEEAKAEIRDFYVDLRAKGQDEDAPVPVTARKLEALVRLAEASARMRLSDTVDSGDAERVIEIVRSCLQDIGVDPETGEFDADVVETGQSKTQRDRIKNVKSLIAEIESEYDEGAPIETILDRAEEVGMERSQAEHEIEKLRRQGDVYEPTTDHLRTV